MSDIHITQSHQLSGEELRQRVENIARELKQKLYVNYQWEGDTLAFKRPGAKGSIGLGKDFVEVKVKLGMLVIPMKDKIEAQIKEKLQVNLS